MLGVALLCPSGLIFHTPRPYRICTGLATELMYWEIAIEPDHPGPYRRAAGMGGLQSAPNEGVTGGFRTDWADRRVKYSGQPGYSLLVHALETKDGHLAVVVLRRKDKPRTTQSFGN